MYCCKLPDVNYTQYNEIYLDISRQLYRRKYIQIQSRENQICL